VPVADTLKRADAEQRVAATEPRDGLWQAQTPQMFRYGQLQKALKNCTQVTDEAGAIEALGLSAETGARDATNLKVTYPADLALGGNDFTGAEMNFESGKATTCIGWLKAAS
jgi:2-C-methyl-D-erythritol 4-phosphate cytidylyltransferase